MMLKRNSAFTLIEVMISLVILSSLAMYTTVSIRNSISIKKKLQKNIDSSSKFRAAINMMERDINLAFHHRDINYEIYKKIKAASEKEAQSQSQTAPPPNTTPSGTATGNTSGTANTNNEPLIDLTNYKEPTDITHFLGAKEALHFTNLNQIRMSAEDKVASQQEVGYFIKTCANRFDPKKTSKCLWRRNAKFIDDNVEEGGNEYVLLEHINFFELKYQGDGKDEWVSEWRSDERGDDATKNNFPNAVELSISTKREDYKEEKAKVVIAIRFPNNKPAEETKADEAEGT